MPPPTRHCMRRLRRSYRRRHQRLFQQPQLLAACELCGFVSGHRAVVARHRRLCSRPPGTCFSCDRCPWTGDSVATYVDHRNTAHGDHIAVFKRSGSKLTSRVHEEPTGRGSVVSVVSGDPPFRCVMTSSAADAEVAGITDTCLPPGVTSSADDDERSLDENLRPMDGQIWLPDVDGGLPDTFQTTTKRWPTSSLHGQKIQMSGRKPEVELSDKEKPGSSSVYPVVDEPLPTSGGLFRCRYCRYTNAHKWKMASHMKASHAGRLVYRCPHCPRFVTDRRVEWCAHRSRHTGKTVFSCSECAYETTMKRNFERHLERHVAGGPRRCTICSYSSTGEGAIQRHMAEYHPPSPTPQPTRTTENSLSEHSEEIVPPVFTETRKFEVQLPPTSSVLLFQPIKTSSTPNGLTPPLGKLPVISCDVTGRWTCPLCPLSYKRPADLNRHMKQKHDVALKDFAVTRSPVVAAAATVSSPPETLYTAAPVSTKIFNTSTDTSDQPLNLSLKESPTVSWSVIDSAVNLSVSEMDQMDQTEPLDLSVVRPRSDVADDRHAVRPTKTTFGYPCNQCTYVSKRASDLRRHQLVHCSSKRYRCPYCVGDRSYKLQFDLGRHMAKVHGKVGGSQHAGVIETSLPSTSNELAVDQPPVPSVPTGSIYGASPEAAGGQCRPGMISATGNSMSCPYCQYVGKNSSELERHARLHSGEKPHRCPHCSFQTVWKGDLTRHIQKVHGDRIVVPNSPLPAETGPGTDFGDAVKPEVDYNMNVDDGRKRSTAVVAYGTRIGNFIADVGRHAERYAQLKANAEWQRGRCPLCPFVCDSPTVMSDHLESHEKSGRRFVCMACGLTFAHRQEGRDHAASLHTDLAAPNVDLLVVEMKPDQPQQSSTSAEESGIALSGPVDVDALAEQYANEVTEMFYGHDSTVTTPAAVGVSAASTVRRFGVAIACRSARADRCRPFKCSHCGRRSNWRWDLKKHIRASRHPNAEVIELSEEEARRSFEADAAATADRPSPPTNKPYRCSRCGHRSNWKSDVTKHIRALHPLSRIVVIDDEEATATLAEYEVLVNREKAAAKVNGETTSAPEEKALYTVDRQKLKRLRCSACPYRSNFRSDVGRHIRFKHRDAGTVPITVMSAVEAAATLQDYMDMWMHRKITPSSHFKPADDQQLKPHPETSAERSGKSNEVDEKSDQTSRRNQVTEDEGFEYVEGEDESLPWKCAACDFIDPTKQVVVDHWQRHHCTQVQVTDQVSVSDDRASLQNVADVSSRAEQWGSWTPKKKKKVRPIAEKTLRCDICPYRTNKLGLLTIHKTYHRPQAKNKYKCPHCPYYVCAPRLLHQHVRIHVNTINDDARSGNGFQDQVPKRGEVATKEADVAQLRCSICPYVGRSKNDIIYHRQFHRSRPTAPFRCPLCPFWVGEKRTLAQHQKVHQGVDRQPTEISGSTEGSAGGQDVDRKGSANGSGEKVPLPGFVDARSTTPCVARHRAFGNDLNVDVGKVDAQQGSSGGQRRRVARTLWRCDRCPYVTAKRSQHATHRQLHGSCQRHTCRLCDYSVGGLHLLMQHVRLHHREVDADPDAKQSTEQPPANDPRGDSQTNVSSKEVRPLFRCDRCPYSNSRRDHLLCHARFHDSDGPLRCPQCDYSVSKVHLLTQHLRVHQLSTDTQSLSKTSCSPHATKDQFMRSLSLTTR